MEHIKESLIGLFAGINGLFKFILIFVFRWYSNSLCWSTFGYHQGENANVS